MNVLHNALKNYRIILGSGSPRRQELLKRLGLEFEIQVKPIDEIYPEKLEGVEITDYLARLKADAFTASLKVNEIVITSDTIVWHKGRALGKPQSREEGIEMLRAYSGNYHEVFTSVCFHSLDKTIVVSDRAAVHFQEMTQDEIEAYMDEAQPYDKAGAYAIQEWVGLHAIHKIEGSYYTIMGFPTHLVKDALMQLIR